MKRITSVAIVLIISFAILYGIQRVGLRTSTMEPGTVSSTQSTTSYTTYTNERDHYSITYPSTWLQHPSPWSVPPAPAIPLTDSQADRVIVGPDPLPDSCVIIQPKTAVTPIDISEQDRSLEAVRAGYRSSVGGQDLVESTTTIDGTSAYLFKHPESVPCPNGNETNFYIFVFEHRGKVMTVSTGLYNIPEYQAVISSIKLL